MKNVFRLWIYILIPWTLYRLFVNLPEVVDEFLVKPLIFIIIPLNFYHMHRLPGFEDKKKVFEDLIVGFAVGFVFAFVALLANKIKHQTFDFAPVLDFSAAGLYWYLFLSLFTAFSEEVLGRAFFFKQLLKSLATFKAALLSSLLFLSLHLPLILGRIHLQGAVLVIYFASVFLLSMVNCYIYKIRKSLVIPILIHLFWNLSVALYL